MEPTPSASQIIAQSEELEKLTKELSKCRADKEFVWGLWKKLQKTNPDLNAAIEMVMIREKNNHKHKIEQLLAYSEEKEGQVERMREEMEGLRVELVEERSRYQRLEVANQELSSVVAAVQSELSTARGSTAGYEELKREHALLQGRGREREEEVAGLQQQLSTQEYAYTSQAGQLSDRIQDLVNENAQLSERAAEWENRGKELQQKLDGFGEQLQLVGSECAREVEASRRLDEELAARCEEVEQREREMERLERDSESVRGELSECQGEVDRQRLLMEDKQSVITKLHASITHKDEMLGQTHALNQELNDKLTERDREISRLRQHLKAEEAQILKLTNLQGNNASTQTSPNLLFQGSGLSLAVLVQLLETRSSELAQMKKSHDRRHQRYRGLQAANKLLKQQLSTYSPDSVPSQKREEKEEGQRFLNQLTPPHTDTDQPISCLTCKEAVSKYRRSEEECAQLAETVSSLEECVDELTCEKCHLETALAELRYSAERERDNILARLSSLRSISSSASCEGEEWEEFEECLLDLERRREEWNGEQQRLSEQLQAAVAELAACKERTVLTSHHSCQTEDAPVLLTSSVCVQTSQQLFRKQYPPLRHRSTQTPPPSPRTPSSGASKQTSELRSLQKRVCSLGRQTELLAEARGEARSALAEEQRRVANLQRQTEETAHSFKVTSAENRSLSAEALILRQANATLEETLQAGLLERDSESSAAFSRLEARLKASSDECVRQAGTLHRLGREVSEKKAEIETLTDSAVRREREHRQNLANKRHLLEEMKEQLQGLKSSKQSSQELISKQVSEVRRVSETNANLSSRNASQKRQLSRLSEALEQERQALSAHAEQLSVLRSECGRKEHLLRAAKTQIDQLSQLFGEEEAGRTECLERRVACLRVSVEECKQAILCVGELIWSKKCRRTGSVARDILSLSTKEIMEVAGQGADPVVLPWTDSSHYTQVVAALEQQPPFARPLAELIINLLEL